MARKLKQKVLERTLQKNTLLSRIVFYSTIVSIVFYSVIGVIYLLYVRPMLQIHTISNTQFLKDFMKNQIASTKDNERLQKIVRGGSLVHRDYWYMYFHIRTKRFTIFTMLNQKNKFSEDVDLCLYGVDHENNTTFSHIIPTNFNNINIIETKTKIIVSQTNLVQITIDFEENTVAYNVNSESINLNVNMDIHDWNTNQATFFSRYWLLRMLNLTNMYGSGTNTPGEWMVDSPFTGKVSGGNFGSENIENGGNFWFDTYIGTNNHFLEPYTWFYIQNDDWIIYLLEFGEYDKEDKKGKIQPILIKNCKKNKWYYSGINTPIPQPFEFIKNSISTFDFTWRYYPASKNIGDDDLANFQVNLVSDRININIQSIPSTNHHVFSYDYYKNDKLDVSKMNSWDKKYYETISNNRFEEYLCIADIIIEADGEVYNFKERVLYEGIIVL